MQGVKNECDTNSVGKRRTKKGGERKRWANRYRVTATFNNPGKPYKSVPFLLFRTDMGDDEVVDLLESCGLDEVADSVRRGLDRELPSEWAYARSLVEETFDAEQVQAMILRLCQEKDLSVAVNAALKPGPEYIGVKMCAFDGFIKNFHLVADGYPDGFAFAGGTGKGRWQWFPNDTWDE